MTPLVILHIGAGSLGILSGFAAVSVRKGERLHRAFGTVFLVSMLIMAAMGAYLALALPQTGFLPRRASVSVAILTAYLVATAWMTARRKDKHVGAFDYGALLVTLGVAAAMLLFGRQAAMSPTGKLEGGFPVQYYVFAGFAAFAAALDLKVILLGGIAGAARIARHLWRMCFGLLFATTFFFIGQQKVMPAYLHRAPILFVPPLAVLALLIFWMLRVRLTNWFKQSAPASGNA